MAGTLWFAKGETLDMLTKIVDRIFRLKVPMPFNMGEVNSYLLEGANGFTIVDTGDNTEEAKAVWLKTLADGLPIEKSY